MAAPKVSAKRKINAADEKVDSKAVSAKKMRKEVQEDEIEESSEDELDSVKEDEEMSSAESGSDEDEEEEGDKGAKSGNNNRAEQKKLKKERKLARANGDTIQQIKQYWEQVRVRTGLPAEKRKKLVDEIWKLSKDNVKELVFKHDSSRVIQTIFKYSDKDRRQAITLALKGSYVDLARSSYGKYLLVKFMHYGSKEVRENVINELHGHFRKLMRHKEGAYVIEDVYRDYSTSAQKAQIMREFYGSEFAVFRESGEGKTLADIIEENPAKRQFVMKNLKEVITSAVNKGSIGFNIIHAAMLEYAKNIDTQSSEREDFIDLISEQFAEIVHTAEGAQVACRVIAMATAKEKKGLVKALRPFVTKMAEDDQGHFVLMVLFDCVDDTVLVGKSFSPELKDHMAELIVSKNGRRPLLYLLLGRSPRYLTPSIISKLEELDELKKTTAKKDNNVRLQELRRAFSPIIFNTIIEHTRDILSNSLGAQFIAEAVLYGAGGEDTNKTAAAMAVVEQFDGCPDEESHLIRQPFSGRMLRTLIQGGHWNNKEKRLEVVEDVADTVSEPVKEKLTEYVMEYPKEWATGEGSFVVVALLENVRDENKKSKLMKKLSKHAKAIKASSNKGSGLVIEKLE